MANGKSTGTAVGLEKLERILRKRIDEMDALELPNEKKEDDHKSPRLFYKDGTSALGHWSKEKGAWVKSDIDESLEGFYHSAPKTPDWTPGNKKQQIKELAKIYANKYYRSVDNGIKVNPQEKRQLNDLIRIAKDTNTDISGVHEHFKDFKLEGSDEASKSKEFYNYNISKLKDALEGKLLPDDMRVLKGTHLPRIRDYAEELSKLKKGGEFYSAIKTDPKTGAWVENLEGVGADRAQAFKAKYPLEDLLESLNYLSARGIDINVQLPAQAIKQMVGSQIESLLGTPLPVVPEIKNNPQNEDDG